MRGIHSVATAGAKGETLTRAILGDLAIYCAHTPTPTSRRPGYATRLAAAVGLTDVVPLEDVPYALGRVGYLAAPMTLRAFADQVAGGLPATVGGIRVSGDPEGLVERVAVLGGSGDDRFGVVRGRRRRLRHRRPAPPPRAGGARDRGAGGRTSSMPGTGPASTSGWPPAQRRLLEAVSGGSSGLDTVISTLRTEPWTFVVGANAANES